MRGRMAQREDRLRASVFLGSGLLFVAMLFVASAVGAGLITSLADASGSGILAVSDAWRLGRAVTYLIMTTHALRMAAGLLLKPLRTAFSSRLTYLFIGHNGPPQFTAGCAIRLR